MNDLFTFASAKNGRALPSKRRARAPKVPYVDPAAMWRSLPPDTAEYLGAMAIAFFLAAEGMNAHEGHERSRFFPGIAAAMAEQWGALSGDPDRCEAAYHG